MAYLCRQKRCYGNKFRFGKSIDLVAGIWWFVYKDLKIIIHCGDNDSVPTGKLRCLLSDLFEFIYVIFP